jgi:ribosomal protein S13
MVAGIKILTVLEMVPGVGKVRARRLLEAAGIDEAERIDQLDEDRRRGLLRELER